MTKTEYKVRRKVDGEWGKWHPIGWFRMVDGLFSGASDETEACRLRDGMQDGEVQFVKFDAAEFRRVENELGPERLIRYRTDVYNGGKTWLDEEKIVHGGLSPLPMESGWKVHSAGDEHLVTEWYSELMDDSGVEYDVIHEWPAEEFRDLMIAVVAGKASEADMALLLRGMKKEVEETDG